MATTIKVAAATRDRVNALGARTGQTAEQVVARALEEYERAMFWEQFAAASDAAARDARSSRDEAMEADIWDAATARDSADRG